MRCRARLKAKLIAAAIVSTLAWRPAAAADWWLLGENIEGAKSFSDADSLRCVQSKCSIWERIIPSAMTADGHVVDSLAEYDCDGGWTATKAEVSYGPRMVRLSFIETPAPKWQLVEVGTMGEDSILFACRANVGSLPRSAGQTILIEGRTYVRDVSVKAPPPSIPGLEPGLSTAAAPAALAGVAPPKLSSPTPFSGGSAYGAQIGAVTSRAAARAIADAFRAGQPQLAPGLKMTVEGAVVAGRKIYRAVIIGFASSADAEAFCETERRGHKPCLVRSAAAD